ncbi:MAG: PD40 domain-containing protein [Bacteroidia bacterium]|nr:PD40 domain-containing protein [Bacteroidia bacterium]
MLGSLHNLFSQTQSKETEALLSKANFSFSNGYYYEALDLFLELYPLDSLNAKLNNKIGICYLYTPYQKHKAQPYLERASQSININYEVNYFLGDIYHLNYQFDKAIRSYEKFADLVSVYEKNPNIIQDSKNDAKWKIQICENAKAMCNSPTSDSIINMGEMINSSLDDYGPLISTDEELLMFTSRRSGGVSDKKDAEGKYNEDIYKSIKTKNTWIKATNIGPPINTNNHDAIVGMAPDGQLIIIYKEGDLFYSSANGNNWNKPVAFSTQLNSKFWEPSASIAADNNAIYFTSDRKGGFGGSDIWIIKKLPDGEWGKAQNLGPSVNTKYDEDAPFIHPDNKTLYYSSMGHNTMGGYDIFKSTLNDDNSWSLPVNMKYPINTTGDDIYLVLAGDGKHGYFSSFRKGGFGDKDIYMIKFQHEEKILSILKGYLMDEKNQPLGARIIVTDNETGTQIGIYKSNSSSGKFLVIIPSGKNYNFKVLLNSNEEYNFKDIYIKNQSEFMMLTDTFLLKEAIRR